MFGHMNFPRELKYHRGHYNCCFRTTAARGASGAGIAFNRLLTPVMKNYETISIYTLLKTRTGSFLEGDCAENLFGFIEPSLL